MGTAPAEVIAISHVALRTAEMERMYRYYTSTLGLWECQRDEDGRVHLTCGGLGADVELIPSDASALDHIGYMLAPGTDLGEVAEGLQGYGVNPDAWPAGDPGTVASLGIRDVEGNRLQLIVPGEEFVAWQEGPGIRPRKLGHVATRVRDSAAIRRFYEDLLGFRFSDANSDGVVFLRCNADHHAANFIEASRPGEPHHIAFEVEDDFTAIQRIGDMLAEHELQLLWGPGRHGPGHSIFTYHRDPDDHIIEIFNQLDRISDERQGYFDPRPWHERRPQRPAVWKPEDRRVAGMTPLRPAGWWD